MPTYILSSESRFRIPDICVMLGPEPEEQVLTSPPFICTEVLSKDDALASMRERIDGSREVKDGILRTENPAIELMLESMFDPE